MSSFTKSIMSSSSTYFPTKYNNNNNNKQVIATSGDEKLVFNAMYYVKAAAAGGICCSVTHGAVTPLDVVKTRIQLDPVKYNKGFIGGFRQVISAEGAGALLTGLGATATGYFVQGWWKFGGVEFFKVNIAQYVGERKAWNNRTNIYLLSSACAEFIADLFLCPLEAVRIRSVSDKAFPQSLPAGFSHMFRTEGVTAFYAGLAPILFKQIPYVITIIIILLPKTIKILTLLTIIIIVIPWQNLLYKDVLQNIFTFNLVLAHKKCLVHKMLEYRYYLV
jgi:hypothetical protein